MRSALVIASMIAGTTSVAIAAPETCRATAVVDGDHELVETVTAMLARRGVDTRSSECPASAATVIRRGTSIVVTVRDPDGRRSERTLADPEAAAAVIESWARRDINAASLIGWLEDPAARTPDATPHDEMPALAPRRSGARERDVVSIGAELETALAFDGTTWLGARGTACITAGPVCVGASARYLGYSGRSSTDVLAAVDLPIGLGDHDRVVVDVGAAAGPGWFVSNTVDLGSTTLGLRLDGHASVSYTLVPHVALVAGVAIGYSPSAPVTLRMGELPKTNEEPSGFVRGELGLRIGAM